MAKISLKLMNNIELYIWEAQPAQAEFFKQRKEKGKKKPHPEPRHTKFNYCKSKQGKNDKTSREKRAHCL